MLTSYAAHKTCKRKIIFQKSYQHHPFHLKLVDKKKLISETLLLNHYLKEEEHLTIESLTPKETMGLAVFLIFSGTLAKPKRALIWETYALKCLLLEF